MEKSPDIFGFIWDPQTGGSQKALNFGQIVEKKIFPKKIKKFAEKFQILEIFKKKILKIWLFAP